jgi:hypothetical protein
VKEPKQKKTRSFNVYLPVCYYEVFSVEASGRREAVQRVHEGHESVEQNCTVGSSSWSRRTFVVETDEDGSEKR